MKEILAQKITSKDDLIAIVGRPTYDREAKVLAGEHLILAEQIAWWAVRERLRVKHGTYELTDACKFINTNFPAFLHVSKGDRNMVAFTPDKVAGEMDRQVITTFGRAASKYLTVFSETYVRNLAEAHAGDLSDEFELIAGEGIAEAYADPTTIGSCMVGKDWLALGLPKSPISQYNMDGIALAVLRNSSGHISARSLVRHDGGKKLYIRANYGDPRLKIRLEKQGYTPGGWEGITFPKVVLSSEPFEQNGIETVAETFLMPYLDSYGSAATSRGSTVTNTEQGILCITYEQQAELVTAGLSFFMKTASSQHAQLTLPLFKPELMAYQDELIGAKVSRLTHGAPIRYMLADGSYGWASGLSLRDQNFMEVYDAPVGWSETTHFELPTSKLYVPAGTETFFFRNRSWIDTMTNRVATGYVQLHAPFYTKEDGAPKHAWLNKNSRGEFWVKKSGTWQVPVADEELGSRLVSVLETDTYRLLENGEIHRRYGSPDPKLKKLWPNSNGSVAYYNGKTEKVLRTVSGKPVFMPFNDNVVTLFDGRYEFVRNAVSQYRSALGYEEAWVPRKLTPEDLTALTALSAAADEQLLEGFLETHGLYEAVYFALDRMSEGHTVIRYEVENSPGIYSTRSRSGWEWRHSEGNLTELKSWLEAVGAAAPRRYTYNKGKGLQTSAQCFAAISKVYLRKIAEMTAIDYNIVAAEPATTSQETHHDATDSSTSTDGPAANLVVVRQADPFDLGTELRDAEAEFNGEVASPSSFQGEAAQAEALEAAGLGLNRAVGGGLSSTVGVPGGYIYSYPSTTSGTVSTASVGNDTSGVGGSSTSGSLVGYGIDAARAFIDAA